MQENEPVEKKRNTTSPLGGDRRKKIYRRSFEQRLRAVKLQLEEGFTQQLELVTHQLNHRRLRSLGHRTPCQLYHDPTRRLRLHGASRQRIFREVFELFWPYVQCMPARNRHTTNAAWRLVVETWLRRQGWISVTEKPKTNVSTNSKAFFSQN